MTTVSAIPFTYAYQSENNNVYAYKCGKTIIVSGNVAVPEIGTWSDVKVISFTNNISLKFIPQSPVVVLAGDSALVASIKNDGVYILNWGSNTIGVGTQMRFNLCGFLN